MAGGTVMHEDFSRFLCGVVHKGSSHMYPLWCIAAQRVFALVASLVYCCARSSRTSFCLGVLLHTDVLRLSLPWRAAAIGFLTFLLVGIVVLQENISRLFLPF